MKSLFPRLAICLVALLFVSGCSTIRPDKYETVREDSGWNGFYPPPGSPPPDTSGYWLAEGLFELIGTLIRN